MRDSQLDFSFSDVLDGQVTDGLPCGHLDAYGRCGASYHLSSCSSLAVIPDEAVADYKDELRLVALLPAGEDSSPARTAATRASAGRTGLQAGP
jgi:hypothetical protein